MIMDSFYEQPRTIITPNLTQQLFPSPVVPEVSMLVQNGLPEAPSPSGDSMLLTYKAWKERNCNNIRNDPLHNDTQSDILKKQVRFENQRQSMAPNGACEPSKAKTFEEIYLANVPNRQLDISVIQSPNKCLVSSKENVNPNINLSESFKVSCNQVSNEKSEVSSISIPVRRNRFIDFYKCDNFAAYKLHEKVLSKEYLRDKSDVCDSSKVSRECDCNHKQVLPNQKVVNSRNAPIIDKGGSEPTVNDLLKIIHQQNEQLLVLQRQVASLLNTNTDMPKQIEAPPIEKYQTSTQIEKPNVPFKRPMQQFSLDVMTSFEVSIRRQQNLRPRKDNYYEPKITEITEGSTKISQESTDDANNKRKPMPLGETARIIDRGSPCPDNIINIDMKDYSSDESSDDEVEDTTNAGWTFYNNIMGQVNEIFKKSGIRPFSVSDKPSTTNEISEDLFKHHMMKKVKEATAKHLRSIGVHVPVMDVSDEQSGDCSKDCSPNDISFAVKQLLMKYLPNEQLAKVPVLQAQKILPQKSGPPGLIQRRPEFSIATLQYMQKYNLLNDDNVNVHQAGQAQTSNQPSSNFERILDITAIRQQPKLL